MSEKIVIFGSGGFGREVEEMLRDWNRTQPQFEVVGFLDGNASLHGSVVHGLPVLGGTEWIQSNPDVSTVIAVGNPVAKRKILAGFPVGYDKFPALISPRAWVGEEVQVGRGTIVCAGTVVTTDISMGEFCTLNLNITIGHDTRMANFVTLAPGVNVSGNVVIEDGVDLGTNAGIIPGITIGEWSIVGAGAVVTRDIPANVTAVGGPAKVIKEREAGWHLL